MRDFDHRWDRNWRRMEAMARRGFRQFGGNFNINMGGGGGPGNDWGGNFRIGKMLASGDLRLVALYLIEQQPRHGYDLIKAIEEKSHHFYSPSPGIVYPALTFLEEANYVTSASEGNKRLYTITDEGRTHLQDNREAIESTLDFLGKAGARMEEWREHWNSGNFPFGGEAPEGGAPQGGPEGGGFPFGGRGGRGGHGGRGRHGGWGPGFGGPGFGGPGFGPPPPPPAPPRPDRDMDDVIPEVNDARKALKKAIKEAVRRGPEEEIRVAEILRRAAQEIRFGLEEDTTDVDLG
jgi:DNA-binding PadR family transcriptional regulator